MTDEATRQRPGGRSARVRTAVLDATLAVLVDSGAAGLSIGEVAKRAGVHETSIYRRWGNREALILDALLANSGEAIPVPDTGTVRGDLVALVRSVAQFLTQPGGAASARAAALNADDGALAEQRRQYWEARYRLAAEIIERGVRRGELPDGLDGLDGQLVLEAVVAPLHMRVLLTHAPIEDDLPERLVDLVLGGLLRTTVVTP